MKALLLVLVFSPAVFAQNLYMDDSQIANGRFWRETPHIAKMMYLIGVGHGLQIALVRAGTDGKCPEKLASIVDAPPGAIIDDYENEFDKLYSYGENLQINVLLAWSYVDAKLKGNLTREQLEKMLIGLRQEAARHVQR